jgi:hypothetical protein
MYTGRLRRGRTLVHVQGKVAYGRSHHVVRMVEEFDGLGVKREVVLGVVEEKLVGGKSNGRVVSGDMVEGGGKLRLVLLIFTWSVLSLSLSDRLLRKEM